MHEWHPNQSKNILSLINKFLGFEFDTDYGGRLVVEQVKITNKMFSNQEEAMTYVTSKSYGSETACLAAYTTKELSRGYWNAYNSFISKYNEYLKFKNELTVAYGRRASKVTCPNCGSTINLKYGKKFRACPVCGSSKIISDTNWNFLDAKKKTAEKAANNLTREAEKNDVNFVCGIEWHC